MNQSFSGRRLAAVWFADLVGYTTLSSQDERAALRLVGVFQDVVKQQVARHGGRIVKFIGDAALAEFSSTEAAVRAALALRQELADSTAISASQAQLRIGLHVGDVLSTRDGDVYGDGVNIASRLQKEANPGQVLVSEDVWRQLRARTEYVFDGVGERELKGIPLRMAVFHVTAAEGMLTNSGEGPLLERPTAAAPVATMSGGLNRLVRPTRAAALLAIAMALGAVVTCWYGPAVMNRGDAFELDRLTQITSEGGASLAAIAPDGRHIAHVKDASQRPSLWVRQRDTVSDIQIVGPGHDSFDGVTFSRDGSHIYYVAYSAERQMGTLFRVPALGGMPARVIEDVDTAVGFSPDGRRFAFIRGEPATGRTHLLVADADGSNLRSLLTLGPDRQLAFAPPSWSPDAARILVVVTEAIARDAPYSVDVSSGALMRLSDAFGRIFSADWLPGGRSFILSAAVTIGGNTQIWEVAPASGKRRRVTNDLTSYTSLSLTAKGDSLVAVQSQVRASLWIVSRDGGNRPLLEARRDDGVFGLAWTAGDRIVFQSNRLGSRQLWAINTDGTNLRQITEGPDAGYPAVSPDGRSIVYARANGESVELWRGSFDAVAPVRLVSGGTFPAVCNDGWVYYSTLAKSLFAAETYRVRLNGGASEGVTEKRFFVADCLPIGGLLGYTWNEEKKRNVVARLTTSGNLQLFEHIPTGNLTDLKATPDGSGVSVLHRADRNREVWMTTFEETLPVQITHSGADDVFAYDWSPDGLHLVVSRGHVEQDVVLLQRK